MRGRRMRPDARNRAQLAPDAHRQAVQLRRRTVNVPQYVETLKFRALTPGCGGGGSLGNGMQHDPGLLKSNREARRTGSIRTLTNDAHASDDAAARFRTIVQFDHSLSPCAPLLSPGR
ncbi:protein of unknown function [Pararobbsia alpina]